MHEYNEKSFEELRSEDYAAGNKGSQPQGIPASFKDATGSPVNVSLRTTDESSSERSRTSSHRGRRGLLIHLEKGRGSQDSLLYRYTLKILIVYHSSIILQCATFLDSKEAWQNKKRLHAVSMPLRVRYILCTEAFFSFYVHFLWSSGVKYY